MCLWNWFSGPGPAKYMLPPTVGFTNHDYTKERLPMYSMAPRYHQRDDTAGPGSAKYNLEYKTHIGEKHINAYMGHSLASASKSSTKIGKFKILTLSHFHQTHTELGLGQQSTCCPLTLVRSAQKCSWSGHQMRSWADDYRRYTMLLAQVRPSTYCPIRWVCFWKTFTPTRSLCIPCE